MRLRGAAYPENAPRSPVSSKPARLDRTLTREKEDEKLWHPIWSQW
jgi:hypothetical protein